MDLNMFGLLEKVCKNSKILAQESNQNYYNYIVILRLKDKSKPRLAQDQKLMINYK